MWAYVYEDGKVVKRRVPRPALRPNDVLIRIEKVSVCGSDFHIFANDDWARETITPGMVIGHEGCGTVIELGDEVDSLSTGDFVALESHYACPHCEAQGRTADDCSHFGIIGVHGSQYGLKDHETGGVFAEYLAIPHYCCHKVTDTIRSSFSPSLLEPAGNSFEIVRFLRDRGLPESLAIFGCGPHGLNLQLFMAHSGVKNIVAFEKDSHRLNYARRFGAAHHVLNPEELSDEDILKYTAGKGFDVAIDMVGNLTVVESCKNLVTDGGLIILFGLPRHEALIAHGENFSQIIFHNETHEIRHGQKSLTVRGFTGRTEKTWMALLQSLNESDYLRKKLAEPVDCLGDLHKLEDFIESPPQGFLKVSFTAFGS
ncbi:MAG: alcohol dehydrogenase catalytic domain-containing protein [Spirochaetota bacterium]|nr:alcohol dehydrogenase catalytic domain-containing protein [Spirochaetota bacterium]